MRDYQNASKKKRCQGLYSSQINKKNIKEKGISNNQRFDYSARRAIKALVLKKGEVLVMP
jgi:hypothetical protein